TRKRPKPLSRNPRMRRPMTEPKIDPFPPLTLAPPRMTAAIDDISYVLIALGCPDISREARTTPANPAQNPLIAIEANTTLFTLIPHRRAATLLEPTA